MLEFLRRLQPNQRTLVPTALAALFAGCATLLIWLPAHDPAPEMDRFGQSVADSMAQATRGLLLNKDRIELAVLATELTAQPEIRGVAFYDPAQEVLAMSGSLDDTRPYNAHAALEDTITGYVAVALNRTAFAGASPLPRIAGTLLVVLLSPLVALGLVQITTRGSRSLPIVSVPDAPARVQQSYCLVINPYNLIALSREAGQQVIQDAVTMANEVCALYAGLSLVAAERGVLVVLDRETVTPTQALSGAFLLQQLLHSYETEGEFRCYLTVVDCPGSPAELGGLTLAQLDDSFDFEHAMTMAALAKPLSLLMDARIFALLDETLQACASELRHPMVEDAEAAPYEIGDLPPRYAAIIAEQQGVILGFQG